MPDGFVLFPALNKENPPPPSITYCAFCFASHPSHVVCRLSGLFAVLCVYLTLSLAIFVSSVPLP